MGKHILVTRSSMPEFDEYIDEIRELWDSRWLTNMGVKHKELQEGLREYLGARRVLTLPLYADLKMEDVDRICEMILGCRI